MQIQTLADSVPLLGFKHIKRVRYAAASTCVILNTSDLKDRVYTLL